MSPSYLGHSDVSNEDDHLANLSLYFVPEEQFTSAGTDVFVQAGFSQLSLTCLKRSRGVSPIPRWCTDAILKRGESVILSNSPLLSVILPSLCKMKQCLCLQFPIPRHLHSQALVPPTHTMFRIQDVKHSAFH